MCACALTAVSNKHDVGAEAPVAPVALVGLGGELVVAEDRLQKLELAGVQRRVSLHRAAAWGGSVCHTRAAQGPRERLVAC